MLHSNTSTTTDEDVFQMWKRGAKRLSEHVQIVKFMVRKESSELSGTLCHFSNHVLGTCLFLCCLISVHQDVVNSPAHVDVFLLIEGRAEI